ncbi:unnamed protein product, partial [Medioppia subpectinata]
MRQKGTAFIKEMAETLKLLPIVSNTGIVYFHRFFTLRSFKVFDVNQISICSLFLAAKFEEQPIRKEDLIRTALFCRPPPNPSNRPKTEHLNREYRKQCDRLIANENEMLLTFGFDLMVIHSQSVIVNVSKSVINESVTTCAYRLAGDLLRLTTICLQYSHTFIACVSIYMSSHFLKTPITTNGSHNWCHLIDSNVRLEEVREVAAKFKPCVNALKYTIQSVTAAEKKRKRAYEETYSPESAYSSGSNTSPDDYSNPTTTAATAATTTTIKGVSMAPKVANRAVVSSAVSGGLKSRPNLCVSINTDRKRK